jgi:hypothetical protein
MTDPVVTFALRPELPPDDHEAILSAISWVRGVLTVTSLAPESDLPALRRLGTATVDARANPHSVAEAIASLDGIEYAEVAAGRGPVEQPPVNGG